VKENGDGKARRRIGAAKRAATEDGREGHRQTSDGEDLKVAKVAGAKGEEETATDKWRLSL